MQHYTLVVSGPPYIGKSRIVREFVRLNPKWRRAVSCTTQVIRNGNQDGIDYHYLTDEEFAALMTDGKFLESSKDAGRWFGIRNSDVTKAIMDDVPLICETNFEGLKMIQANIGHFPTTLVCFYVYPQSIKDYMLRLQGLGYEFQDVERFASQSEYEVKAAIDLGADIVRDYSDDSAVHEISFQMGLIDGTRLVAL